MKSISTLPSDIYKAIEDGIEVTEDELKELGSSLAKAVLQSLGPRDHDGARLRMSNIGTPCDRKLWYTVNQPEKAEPLDGRAKLKFAYGHLIDVLMPFLVKKAGHKVAGEQTRLEYDGIIGHRDCIIDGVVVDVKSASSRGMDKFKRHDLETNDPFAYLDQLNLYREASANDPDVEVKGEAAFLVVDKVNGSIVLDKYKKSDKDYSKFVKDKKELVASKEVPRRGYFPKPEGSSGNYIIPMECGYCAFKTECYKDSNDGKGLKEYIYSTGPKWFTRVVKEPRVGSNS